ncbi:hypothetical protein [Burkholderia pseudomallei]|uniref:hypothetical protein n=1 Tax=Burkholderia pseudomallei TaxID=28450 RepID=UPI00105C1B9C|nr:hypothetical protein [Burkholderia pseudomallei]
MNHIVKIFNKMTKNKQARLILSESPQFIRNVFLNSHNQTPFTFPVQHLSYLGAGEVKSTEYWIPEVSRRMTAGSGLGDTLIEFKFQDDSLMLWMTKDKDKSFFCLGDTVISFEDYGDFDMMAMVYPELKVSLDNAMLSWELFMSYLSPAAIMRQKALDSLSTEDLVKHRDYSSTEAGKLEEIRRLERWTEANDRISELWE